MQEDNNLLKEVDSILKELFPICRSISGPGLRETLSFLNSISPFEIKSFKSGTEFYDWEIPKEWSIKDAYIKDQNGNRVVDFKESNLHVVNYSIPVQGKFPYDELKNKIHTLPNLPDAIPYRTSYYNNDWGFCMTHNAFLSLDPDMVYEVQIDSQLEIGEINYGETFLKVREERKLFSLPILAIPLSAMIT